MAALLRCVILLVLLALSAQISANGEEGIGNSTEWTCHQICTDYNNVHGTFVDELINVTLNHTMTSHDDDVRKSDLQANISSIEITFTDVKGAILYSLKFNRTNKHITPVTPNATFMGEELAYRSNMVNKPDGMSGTVVAIVLLSLLLVLCVAFLLDFHVPAPVPPLDEVQMVDVLVQGGEEPTSQQHQHQEEEEEEHVDLQLLHEDEDGVEDGDEDEDGVEDGDEDEDGVEDGDEDEDEGKEEEVVTMFSQNDESDDPWSKKDDRAEKRMSKEFEWQKSRNRRGV